MSLPRWPTAWVRHAPIGDEQTVGVMDGVELVSAERADGQVLMSLTWPGGRRWLRVDPSGAEPPETLRAGELAEDHELARQIEALWSQALRVAKLLIDGELDALVAPPPDPEPSKWRRPWRRD